MEIETQLEAFDQELFDGNHTEDESDVAEPETEEQELDQEAEGEPESVETTENDTEDGAEEVHDDGEQEGDEGQEPEQKFTLKVNSQTREVGLQEMTELAQKGADYDRVKDQVRMERQTSQGLREQLDKQQPCMDVLTAAAEKAGVSLEDLLEQIEVNLLTQEGYSEREAKLELRARRAEAKNTAQQKQEEANEQKGEDPQERINTEISEFQQAFPGVRLTDEQLEKMMPDVQSGMTLTNAYLKMENARLQAELEAQKKQEAAAEKNRRNRVSSPRSQRDSGGKSAADDLAIFEKALFG